MMAHPEELSGAGATVESMNRNFTPARMSTPENPLVLRAFSWVLRGARE